MKIRKFLLMLASIGTFGLAMQVSDTDDTQAVVKKAAATSTEMAKAKDAAKDKAKQAVEKKADADHEH